MSNLSENCVVLKEVSDEFEEVTDPFQMESAHWPLVQVCFMKLVDNPQNYFTVLFNSEIGTFLRKDFKREEEAWVCFLAVICQEVITVTGLKQLGFELD